MVAQGELVRGHQDLLDDLQKKRYGEAAKKAHRLKATANLYASDALLSYYEMISTQQDLIYSRFFMDDLIQELQRAESNISDFLKVD